MSPVSQLLNWRNTPTEGIRTSPAQRFFGHRCKTLLPMLEPLLHPRYPTESDTQALRNSISNSTITARPRPSNPLLKERQYECDYLAKPHGVLVPALVWWAQGAVMSRLGNDTTDATVVSSVMLGSHPSKSFPRIHPSRTTPIHQTQTARPRTSRM